MPPQTLSLGFSTQHGELMANGKPFTIKGTTWWGAESGAALPGGLRYCSVDEIVTFVSRNSFNAIKIPLLHQHVLFNEPIPIQSFDARLNPFLLAPTGEPISYLDMLLVVAKRAAARGLLVWLMAHSVEQLWFSRSISEDTVRDSWSSLSRQLCNQWNIVGVDLKNKPSAGSWGKDLPTDWNRAAERLGNHVLSGCERWLISVEGVGQKPGARQDPEIEFASQVRFGSAFWKLEPSAKLPCETQALSRREHPSKHPSTHPSKHPSKHVSTARPPDSAHGTHFGCAVPALL